MNNSSSNPSDYEFLLRTLAEGNHLAKAESLKRFNTLVLSDKKQFSSYAKRIVIAIQQLMLEQKEEINLLAGTLALEIINLNPKDIEFYVKTKLLRPMVVNLGDLKPQIRKTSHYCLLAYVRMFHNFDDLIDVYVGNGLLSPEWQLRQKAINSFQSILVMEMKYLNWASAEFRKIFELLLGKLKDENGFVQKAAEQCLLSLSKIEEIRSFAKKLPVNSFQQLRGFCEQQYELGNLAEVKLDLEKPRERAEREREPEGRYAEGPPSPQLKQNQNTVSLINTDKLEKYRAESPAREPQEELSVRQRGKERGGDRGSLRKAESVAGVNAVRELQNSLNLRSVRNHEREERERSLKRESSLLFPPIAAFPVAGKQERLEQLLGRKVMEDLRNDKDWKVRLEAIEELQTKFLISRAEMDAEVITRSLLPVLIRLLGDANFKVALIALKILEDVLRIPEIAPEAVVPQVVQKLTDNKVALRQNIGKLIRSQYALTKEGAWVDQLLVHLRKTANANVREEILSILLKFYEEGNIPYSYEKVLEAVFPLMDDLKTKIKIKTLDLLALITIRTQKVDRCKALLAAKLNQVYYEMYLEKIAKELRNNPQPQEEKGMRASVGQMPRKVSKVGNTTATSLQRFSPQKEQNTTVKTAFYDHHDEKMDSITSREDVENEEPKEKDLPQVSQVSQLEASPSDEPLPTKKRIENRYLRRRVQKSTQSRLSTTNYSADDAFPPFSDPAKELRNMVAELKSEDWQVSNEALNKFRRIVLHHAELLTAATLKAAMPDLMRLAESLRSTLSKNALVVLNELSGRVKRQLDPEFDLVFSKLIKKSLDTNSFISEEVRRALITVCSNCNESKVLSMLHNSHISRAIPIKTAIANVLEAVAFLPRFYEREIERIVGILVDFMNEGSLEIREKTKNLLNSIIASEKGPALLKLIPIEHRNKLKKREESILSQSRLPLQTAANTIVAEEKEKSIVKEEEEQQYPRRKKKNKITDFPSQFDELQGHLQGCESSDWKVRLQSMSLISQVCLKFHEEMAQHKASSRVIDVLSKQINDPNVKVALNALRVFQELTNQIPSLIESSLSVIMNEVFVCFSSAKTQIRALAEEFFETICGKIETWMLTQHLCNGALYSVQKSRPIILDKLRRLVPVVHKCKPNIFQKNVYAMINKVAEENKPEITAALKDLLETIYTEVGEDCMSFLKQRAKSLIFE